MRVWRTTGLALTLWLMAAPMHANDDEMPAVTFMPDEVELPEAMQATQVDSAAAADIDTPARPAAGEALEPAATTARTGRDLMDLDATAIRGNQELPKVLYIVPWKDPSLGELVGKPVNSLVDEVIAPVDREVFLRQTKYFDQLYADPGATSD